MVIYGDILFILNMIIDYLLLGLTAVVAKRDLGLLRRIIASLIGGLSSFYIFVESENIVIDLLFRLTVAIIMILTVFGFKSIRILIKSLFIYYSFSVFLSGVSILLSNVIKTNVIEINNTYFYIGISPIILIISSVIFYVCLVLFFRIKKGSDGATECSVTLFYKYNSICLKGLIDSGNSICDLMSDSKILISSEKTIKLLTGTDIESYFLLPENADRCRVIPASTVAGNTVLKAVRIDNARLVISNKEYSFSKPIIAVSANLKDQNYDLIIPKSAIEGD